MMTVWRDVPVALSIEEHPGEIGNTSQEAIIAQANKILSPYSLEVKGITWWSVYEVAHRVTDGFDYVSADQVGIQRPHAFIMGDACHTHSAKAGPGMNVSIQDGWNLSWKLAAVLEGRAPELLLDTSSSERKVIAQNQITTGMEHQGLATGFPVGKRFTSTEVIRRALGADGFRWAV